MLLDELKSLKVPIDTKWLDIFEKDTYAWSHTWKTSEKLEKLSAFEEYIKELERDS